VYLDVDKFSAGKSDRAEFLLMNRGGIVSNLQIC
jgi:hypothetical protein